MMRAPAGFTLVELLVSMTIAAVALAFVLAIVRPAREAFTRLPEASDVQQRVRVAVSTLRRDLLAAGAGPRERGAAVEATDAPVRPYRVGLRGSDPAAGRFYHPGVISLVRARPSAPGSPAELIRRTYYLRIRSADDSQLMQDDGGEGDFPLLENVVGLDFEDFGDPRPPEATRTSIPGGGIEMRATYGPWPPRPEDDDPADAWGPGESCVWAAVAGEPRTRLATLSAGTDPVRLDEALLTDGPWCPDAAHPERFDADSLRIRLVRVRLRVQAPRAFRGVGSALFTHAGDARTTPVPDQEIRFDVAPRNLGGQNP